MDDIKTYIVNLERAKERRLYMEELLRPFGFLDIEFINAVDGRKMTEEELSSEFNSAKCMRLIGRSLNRGEIGCTLSHRECCRRLIKTDDKYAIVFEDDISIIRDLNELQDYDLDSILNTSVPTVLMLSGDFWYFRRDRVVSVYDCVGAYAYILNRAAAELILSEKPCGVSDNWRYYIGKGLKIKAILPYMVDANLNMDLLSSDVNQYSWGINRSKMSKVNVLRGYWSGAVKKILKLSGRFEYKTTVRYGKPCPGSKH